MEDEIDLLDIFRVLWKRRLQIIGVFVAAVLLAGMISFAMPPVYRVSSIIAVGNFGDPAYASQTSLKSIMLSDEFLSEVFETISPNETAEMFEAFKDSIKIDPVKDSDRLIEIAVETPDRQEGLKAVEKMIQLYAERSEDSYNKQKMILSDQLAATQERLIVTDIEINLTQDALQQMQDYSGPSAVEAEMRFSRTLDRLSGIETKRSAMIDRRLELKKQVDLLRHLEVVQPTREPVSPIWPRKALIVAIAGMLGLMVGIFAAFLREGLEKPVE